MHLARIVHKCIHMSETNRMNRILITSAIPYINGIKHLGNLVGSQLPADLYARFMRATGHEVLFLCATDEHGTPAELAATKNNEDIEIYCEKMHAVQAQIAQDFGLSFDHFGRSSSPENHKLTQYFAGRLFEAGLIGEVLETQIYSKTDGRFLPDRYIEGTCPNCGYEKARGDQCEECTKQLEPIDLVNPVSAISGASDLEIRKTKHLHLRQSLMKDALEEWIDSKKNWPILTTSIAKKWLRDGDGLNDRGITRDLRWGIPVKKGTKEWAGMENKVFYVWFDAPIEYIACAHEWAKAHNLKDAEWLSWWRDDMGGQDVKYVQFMGKDNVPFHTLSFPITLIGANSACDDKTQWKLVDYIKSFNYLTYEGGQFSTSLGRGIFQNQALEILPADYWRWWLLSNAPESSDSEFTWKTFQTICNKDLADVLGNFVSRITKFCASKFDNYIPEGDENLYMHEKNLLWERIKPLLEAYTHNMQTIEIRKASVSLRALWALGNEYLQERAPWTVYKKNTLQAGALVRTALNLIPTYATLSAPFIPHTAEKLHSYFNSKSGGWCAHKEDIFSLKPGYKFSTQNNLFTKIDDAQREEWMQKYSGISPASVSCKHGK